MKTLLPSLAVLLAVLAVVYGCSNEPESKPYFTRIVPNEACGVAPYEIEFLAIVTGGTESTDPTGANMWYEISWDFGDGGAATGSKAYHTFAVPDTYTVRATASDDNGAEAVITSEIVVLADTLSIVASSDPPSGSEITAGTDTVRFDVVAEVCGLDPEDDLQYGRFAFRWTTGDVVLTGRRPSLVFDAGLTDTQWVFVSVDEPALSVTRRDSLFFLLNPPR